VCLRLRRVDLAAPRGRRRDGFLILIAAKGLSTKGI
jgi:hypothetical protein